MKRICVFCGSRTGALPEYQAVAQAVGVALAQRQITLVYGGGNVGLMGILADAVLRHGGTAIGVIPRALVHREVAHTQLSELCVVGSMHERKQQMADLSDGFIALPGGIGTLEEFTEIFTWAQLGLHLKPCGLLNVAGYYDRLIEFLDHTVAEGFLAAEHRSMLLVAHEPEHLLEMFRNYKPPRVERWLDRAAT